MSYSTDSSGNVYSFELNPEYHKPSGTCNFSKIDDILLNLQLNKVHYEKNKFYFREFGINEKEIKRKYNNDWNELREYVGFNDIEVVDNELVLINLNYKSESLKVFATNYNILRIMSGMGGLAYST